MTVQLVVALLTDAPIINKIYNQTIDAGLATADTEPTTLVQREHWMQQHFNTNRTIWLIKNESSETLGWLSVSDFYGRPAYRATVEVSLYLDQAAQGKGYARAAMQELFKLCPQLGIKNIMAFVFAHNYPSVKLFESLGFKRWGLFPEIADMPQGKRSLEILGIKIAD